jgi:hypothetical protein
MATEINRDLFIYNLTCYLLKTVGEIKGANNETQERWISEIQHSLDSKYLDPSFIHFYSDKPKAKGVDLSTVWDDIIKVDKWNAISILSDLDVVLFNTKEDLQEKAIIYLMNEFVRGNSIKVKIFPN